VTTHAIKLTSPHELLAVVPYLLGFCPTNSIVTLCLSLDPPRKYSRLVVKSSELV
jgi:hypothetical protein